MSRSCLVALALLLAGACQPPQDPVTKEPGAEPPGPAETTRRVLIVTDESDRMQPLANFLRERGNVDSTIIDYATLPADERRLPHDVARYDALVGYIHDELN